MVKKTKDGTLPFKIKTNRPTLTKKCRTAPIHWEIHSKKGSARIKKGSLETKNAGFARDEGPIWADDVN